MIGKIVKGKSFKGCLAYVLSKPNCVIVNANIGGETVHELAAEFEMSRQLRPKLEKTVCHIILSLHPREKLNDGSWQEIFDRYLARMGFTNNQFIAVKHTDREHEHIHLITSRVRLDGSVVSDSWDRTRSQTILRDIEQEFDLTPVKSSWESNRSEKTKSQIIDELETGLPAVKKQLADRIDAALSNATTIPELIEQLNRDRIQVKISRDREGNPNGISYKLDNVSVAGSRVGKAYSLPQILTRLNSASAVASENNQDEKKNIDIDLIPEIIRENVTPGVTMPELINRLKQSGVDAHVKYTRTKKVKGISFSIGNDSIQGNELGKEYSWNGLQKYLQVSFEPERDNPIIQKMQGIEPKIPRQALSDLNTEQTTMEIIRRVGFAEEDRTAVENSVAKAVETNPNLFIEKYIQDPRSFNGRYIAADLFKETFEQFSESKAARNRYNNPVHNSAAVLSAEQFRRTISDQSYPERDTVIFLTGIPGAGKTSSILHGGEIPQNCKAIFEGQLSNFETTKQKIQQTLDAKLKPLIVAVHTKPENALKNTFKRFKEEGRGASINVMSAIQAGLPDSLRQVHKQFGDIVNFKVYDYRNRSNPITLKGWNHLNIIESEGNYDQIKQRLLEAAAQERIAGTISDDCYRQAISAAPLDYRRMGRADNATHEANVRGRGVLSTDSEETHIERLEQSVEPSSRLSELALDLERLRSLQEIKPVQQAAIEDEILIDESHEINRSHQIAAIARQLLDDLGSDDFVGKDYRVQRHGDSLTIEQLQGDRRVILQMRGHEVEIGNLTELDEQRFVQALENRETALRLKN
jgi:hypothetical protein